MKWLNNLAMRFVQTRTVMRVVRNHVEDNWLKRGNKNPYGESPQGMTSGTARLRSRSRRQIKTNPTARGLRDVWVSNLIGTGIQTRSLARDKEQRATINNAWLRWIDECDFYGLNDLYGLQAQAAGAMFDGGEALVRFVPQRPGSMQVPLKLQILEADLIDHGRTQVNNRGYVTQGVQFNNDHQRIGYWLFDEHPGGGVMPGRGMQSRFVSTEFVKPVYEILRPGQLHGLPWLTPVMTMLDVLDELAEAELLVKKVQSCIAAFVTGMKDEDFPDASSGTAGIGTEVKEEDDQRIESFEPAMVEYLREGEDVKFNTPPSGSSYEEAEKAMLKRVTKGVGVTYEQGSGDLKGVNYSSMRGGALEFRRLAEQRQWLTFIPMMCKPVWRAFIDYGAINGNWRTADYAAEYSPQRWDWIDPLKDTAAIKQQLRTSLISLPEAIRQIGYDPDVVLKEISETLELLDQLGIVSESDPRNPEGNTSGRSPRQDDDNDDNPDNED